MSEIRANENLEERGKENCAVASIFTLTVTLLIAIIALVKYVNISNVSNERVPTVVDKAIQSIIDNKAAYSILPTRYAVDENFWIPPTDQAQRGTCWIFATLFSLESQYRENGIRKGFLKPNQYVSFSKQAYGAWLGETCLKHPDTPICHHGAYGKFNNTEDQLVDSIYYFVKDFPDLSGAILPEEVCPYYTETDPSTDFKCPGMYDAIKTNPIEFKIKSYSWAVNVNETKKLLVEKKRPLGIGIGIGVTEYYAPCDSSSYSTSDQCVKKVTPCPANYESEFCHRIVIDNRNRDGAFILADDYNRTRLLGAHEMNVVGYNDDWVYMSRFTTSKSLSNLKGGFILHNSWREQGHSVEYLLGKRSEENEAVICPNHGNPQSWIPGDYKCLLESGGHMFKCPTPIKVVRGKGIASEPDLLKCVNSQYCNINSKYALSTAANQSEFRVNHLFSGLDMVNMIEFKEDGTSAPIKFDKLPYHSLAKAFVPVELVQNNKDDCGYYMYPYEAVASVQQHDWSLLDYFHTSDLEFEFPDSAYAANKAEGKDYTLLEKSTHEWNKFEFDGPLPYKFVY